MAAICDCRKTRHRSQRKSQRKRRSQMCDDKENKAKADDETSVDEVKDDIKAPVSAICDGASANAAAQVDDDSEIKPVEGFFLTSQRWH